MRKQEKAVVKSAIAFVASPNEDTTRALNEAVDRYKKWRSEVDARPLWRWVYIDSEMFKSDVEMPAGLNYGGGDKEWHLISADNMECAGFVYQWRAGDSYGIAIEGDEARCSLSFEKFAWAVEEVETHTTDGRGWPHDDLAEWPAD